MQENRIMNFFSWKMIFCLQIMLFCNSCTADKPEISLSSYRYDFGKIKSDSIYQGSIIISNLGKAPLVIENVNPGCGCTHVKYSKDIIPPRDTCLLTFDYKTYNKKWKQKDFVNIIVNTDSIVHVLEINAYVIN